MQDSFDADVVIIGGGPVGLATAMNLDAHGVTSIIIEEEAFLEPPSVRSNHVSARTMEFLRRFGLAERVRAAGLPQDYRQDVVFRTSVTGVEFGGIPIPSTAERKRGDMHGPDTLWATPEGPHRVNQTYLEPILEMYVKGLEHVDLRNGQRASALSQDKNGVEVTVQVLGSEAEHVIRGRYLVGADGGRSIVRKAIGARFTGDPVLQHVQSTCIVAPGLNALMQADPAWGYYVYNARRHGHVYAVDGVKTFLVHTYLSDEETRTGAVNRDRALRDILGVDNDFVFSIVSHEDWVARRLVADRFRDRRFFIAGDAAHLWVPMGGYGMNAGIADGANLSWLLSAVVTGWADESMLDAYEAERQPITEQVSQFAMTHLKQIDASDVPADLEAVGERAEQTRREFGALVYDLNVQQFAAEGLNFGYSYGTSPIIVPDGVAPSYTMGTYTPSTIPGCRLPHLWMPDGSSLYDHLGPWYTLVVADDGSGALSEGEAEWVRQVQESGLPIEPVVVPRAVLSNAYTTRYVVVRQDQHAAWRGDTLPIEVVEFAARLGALRKS